MSTKYYGYRIRGLSRDAATLTGFAHKVAREVVSAASDLRANLVAKEAAKIVDFHAVGELSAERLGLTDNAPGAVSPLAYCIESFHKRERAIRQSGYRDPEVDFETSITFFGIGRHLLARFNSEQPSLRGVFERMDGVESFDFWNHADRPPEISLRQWRRRQSLWELAIPAPLTPTEAGLTITLIGDYTLGRVRVDDVVRLLPPVDERTDRIARSLLTEERFRDDRGSEVLSMVDATSTLQSIFAWFRTPEGQATVLKRRAAVRQKIKDALTAEDLVSTYAICLD